MKPRILFYSLQPNDSTSWWRMNGVLPHIKSPDFELVDISHLKGFSWNVFAGSAAFILQRPFAAEHVGIIKLAKDMNVRVILEYDDDLLSIDFHNPTYQQYVDNAANIRECLSLADEVWVSTQGIKDSFNHKNCHVILNSHNDYLYPVSSKRPYNPDTRKVIYRGGSSHQADINEVANDLVQIINENPTWVFQFLGDRYTYLEQRCLDNYHIIRGFPIVEYFKYYYNENSNIAIFPLCDTVFNRGKSAISWLEASYAGSAFFGNTDLPEFKREGAIHFSQLETGITTNFDMLADYNNRSWQEICDTLLLSKINLIRTERILANLQ